MAKTTTLFKLERQSESKRTDGGVIRYQEEFEIAKVDKTGAIFISTTRDEYWDDYQKPMETYELSFSLDTEQLKQLHKAIGQILGGDNG